MFTQLMPLLSQNTSVQMILTSQGDQITVTLIPKPKAGQDIALSQPLCLIGTAEELDAGFVAAVQEFTAVRTSLAEQIEATTSILEAARKASATKSTSAVSKASKSAAVASKSDSTPSSGVDEDEDGDKDEGNGAESKGSDSAATSSEPASAIQTAENIFTL